MSPNTSRSCEFPSAGTRVHSDLLPDDKAIGHKLANGLARVCIGDFVDFVGIKPDLALTAANDRGREALLGA